MEDISTREDTSRSDTWTTQSKKEMFLGFIVVIAGIGTEPLLGTFSSPALFVSLLIILIGVYIAVLGFLHH